MQSSGAWDAKVEFRDIKSALDLKLRGKHFCTNLTSKGQRGVFLSLYHQENYVRIQPAGKHAQTIRLARAFFTFVHFFAVVSKTTTCNSQV